MLDLASTLLSGQIINGTLSTAKIIQAPCFHTHNQCQACWIELAPNSLGQAQWPMNWCLAIAFVHTQMGSCCFTELHSTNCKPRPNNMPYTLGTTWGTRSDSFL